LIQPQGIVSTFPGSRKGSREVWDQSVFYFQKTD